MKARLEALPNVGNVDVLRSAPGSRREYAWTVSFVSNPGYFPPNSRNLALLVPDTSDLEGTGASCEVKERLQGSEPLKGAFQLMFCNSTYADGYADACEYTDLLENDLEAPQFEAILEDLDHVGDVDVSRVTNSDGYTWYITFGGCSLTEDLEDVCNEGDVALMKWLEANSTLTGGSSAPNVTIEEVVRGTGPGTCSDRVDEDGKCVAVETDLSGGEPYAYDILGLETGERVYVRARWHNELGFGPYSLSEPEYETPTSAQRPEKLLQHPGPRRDVPPLLWRRRGATSTPPPRGWLAKDPRQDNMPFGSPRDRCYFNAGPRRGGLLGRRGSVRGRGGSPSAPAARRTSGKASCDERAESLGAVPIGEHRDASQSP